MWEREEQILGVGVQAKYAKGFPDSALHTEVLRKLKAEGYSKVALSCIADYLTDRDQYAPTMPRVSLGQMFLASSLY